MQGIELTPEHPVEAVCALGQAAAAAGFDTVFSSCHYNNRDPFLVLDQVAAVSDVTVGPGVANPYQSHPVVLASQMATLSEITGGRAVLGLGAGDRSTLSNLGIRRDRPVARVKESIEVLRAMWAGDRVEHAGTFVAADAGLNYTPEATIPVFVGAQGPQMLRMSAAVADGVLINASHPRDFEWARSELERGLAERSRTESFRTIGYVSVSVAADAEAARNAARAPVSFIAAGASPRVLDRHGIDGDRSDQIGAYIGAGRFSEAFDLVSDAMLDSFCIAGTPADVTERISEISRDVDGFVAGAPLGPDQRTAVELLGEVFSTSSP